MKNKISYIFILILIAFSGYISWKMYFNKYVQKDTVSIHGFPNVIGDWTAVELPITEKEYEILETRNALTRRYTNSKGEELSLFIVYSQNNHKVSHPPEICYTGSGATVISKQPISINIANGVLLDGNKVIVDRVRSQQVLYYWFKVGNSYTASYWKQQILIALKTLTGQSSSSALIRLSATVQPGKTQEDSLDVIKTFVPLITPHVQTYLP